MASGISSGAWGYSPKMVAGMNPLLGSNLTYQPSLMSTLTEKNPLVNANKNIYSVNFGKRKINEINYLKKQLKLK